MTTGFGQSIRATVLICAAAAMGSLSVYLANGAPLFYFDTAGYLSQGHSMLDAVADAVFPASASGPELSQSAPTPPSPPDRSVDASRSAVYALALSGLDALAGLDIVVFLNLGLIWLALLLVARRIGSPHMLPALRLASLALLAACLGALPFYVAYLMPDILAPVMILMLALIFTYFPQMSRGELLASGMLVLAAVVAHPSHLLIAAVMLPVGLLASPVMARRRLWISVGLIGLLVGVGVAEKFLYAAAVEYFEKKETRYLPFMTARLIVDGPGMTYLASHCPDPELATCALYDELSAGEDTAKLDAPSILFSTSEETGSYKRLSDQHQQAISHEQPEFVLNVVRVAPLAVIGALARNTAVQLSYFRIDMTVPDAGLLAELDNQYGRAATNLRNGRLVTNPDRWMVPLARLHAALYGVSVLAIVWILLKARRHRKELWIFTGLVVAGILANALVCGGVSEPAYRYGARVIFLIPTLVVLLNFSGSSGWKD